MLPDPFLHAKLHDEKETATANEAVKNADK
jgi:hypothetical protein